MFLICFETAKAGSEVEIRFCPAAEVRAYPLESRREWNSILLQNVAVLNLGADPFKITGIDLELVKDGKVLEARKLDSPALERAGARGAKMQAAGVLKQIDFQFCGDAMIPPSVKLGGPTLARD